MTLPRTTEAQARVGRPVSRQALQAGDLVFFRLDRKNRHVGIYLATAAFSMRPARPALPSRASMNPTGDATTGRPGACSAKQPAPPRRTRPRLSLVAGSLGGDRRWKDTAVTFFRIAAAERPWRSLFLYRLVAQQTLW
ncbi:C40 family peptidase [Rhodothermus marinus]|uniref:C40 family peptidase n=1 Tax=Rhodothermus marinus TaxID=29549 RepID=UPI000A81D83B|nr:NlpC/P60 family protein [Rhodothermus marinus]